MPACEQWLSAPSCCMSPCPSLAHRARALSLLSVMSKYGLLGSPPPSLPTRPKLWLRALRCVPVLRGCCRYVIGLPVMFGAFLWRNRAAVCADQALRERGEGDSALTNANFQVAGHLSGVCNMVTAPNWAPNHRRLCLQALSSNVHHCTLKQMRQRYKKIYEDFRAPTMFWKEVLLAR
jgi:hypothetical protein